MATNPYLHVPVWNYRLRLLLPGLSVLGASALAMGWAAREQLIERALRAPAVALRWPWQGREPWWAALDHWQSVAERWHRIPEVCFLSTPVNQLQVAQCREYWSALARGTVLGLLPLLVLLLFIGLSAGRVGRFYRRAAQAVEAGKPLTLGVVQGGKHRQDRFAARMGLRKLNVRPASAAGPGAVIQVYLPRRLGPVAPGARIAVFAVDVPGGEHRLVGIPYAPHVAVIGIA